MTLILMVLVDGRAGVRNRAETFGLERELMERWENSITRGGQTLKGQVVIVDDTVYHNAQGDVSP